MEQSFLHRLPAELRNTIFECALFESDSVPIWREPGLLTTCKSFRRQTELMFYAQNSFVVHMHEDRMNHSLCAWLKFKAGRRLRLIKGLSVDIEMPSLVLKSEAADPDQVEVEYASFEKLVHIMEAIREAIPMDRPIERVVDFKLNGGHDALLFEELEQMPAAKQDGYRGAKFLILCLVHGENATLDAMDASERTGSVEELEKLDSVIRRRRAL